MPSMPVSYRVLWAILVGFRCHGKLYLPIYMVINWIPLALNYMYRVKPASMIVKWKKEALSMTLILAWKYIKDFQVIYYPMRNQIYLWSLNPWSSSIDGVSPCFMHFDSLHWACSGRFFYPSHIPMKEFIHSVSSGKSFMIDLIECSWVYFRKTFAENGCTS